MNIKCPKCGGAVVYDAASGMMKCTACQQEYDSSALSELDGYEQSQELQEQDLLPVSDDDAKDAGHGFRLAADAGTSNNDTHRWTDTLKRKETKSFEPQGIGDEALKEEERIIQYMDLNLYKCTSCGAQLMLSGTEASTFCSFCGLPTIAFDRISKEERPDKIIPFKLTKEQALLCIQDRIGYGKYVPNEIRELSVEDIRGIYMPYWLYTSYMRMQMTLRSTGKNSYTRRKDASCTYENITADAALKLNNTMSERLDPFYMNELEDFDISYLSGFYADKYDVPADAVQKVIRDKARNMLNTAIHKSFSGVATESDISEEYHVQRIDYALLPAYFVTIRYGNNVHLVLVNGQTGKVVTDLPANPAKIKRYMMINIAISCAIYSFVNMLIFSLNDSSKISSAIFLPLLVLLLTVFVGYSARKRYKDEMYHLNSKAMATYVHDRN